MIILGLLSFKSGRGKKAKLFWAKIMPARAFILHNSLECHVGIPTLSLHNTIKSSFVLYKSASVPLLYTYFLSIQ